MKIHNGKDEFINSDSSEKIKKVHSHNFQKHAVTTVRKLMKVRYHNLESQTERLAHKMWTIFMSSGIKSKKILIVLFGMITTSNEKDVNLFTKCGFKEILSEGQHLIRQAQDYLRNLFC